MTTIFIVCALIMALALYNVGKEVLRIYSVIGKAKKNTRRYQAAWEHRHLIFIVLFLYTWSLGIILIGVNVIGLENMVQILNTYDPTHIIMLLLIPFHLGILSFVNVLIDHSQLSTIDHDKKHDLMAGF